MLYYEVTLPDIFPLRHIFGGVTVEENLHITFLENKPNVAGKGPTWLFDLDYLTDYMNYHPVSSENQANLHAGQQEANQNAGTEEIIDAGDSDKEDESAQDYFVLPIWPSYSSTITPALTTDDKREGPREEEQVFMDDLERLKRQEKEANEEAEVLRKKFEHLVIKDGAAKTSSTNIFSPVSTPAKASSTNIVNTVSIPVSTASPHEGLSLSDPTNPEEDDSEIPPLEDIYQNSTDGIFTTSSYDDEGAVADFTNLETVVNVSPIPTLRIHSTHPKALILGDPNSAVQTRSKIQDTKVCVLVDFALWEAGISYKVGSSIEIRRMKEELLSEIKQGHMPKSSHLSVVKRIFRIVTMRKQILTRKRKSTNRRLSFLSNEIISWQCKKQTIVATSTTEAEYVAAASCCGQVLWIQNQMLDYGFNFMNTKIYIDNESTICIVKNPVYHSNTKHIAIRHHFIRDAYEKKLIQVLKIHTDDNVADLLTKAFDVSSRVQRVIDFSSEVSIHHALTKGKHFSGKVTPLFATMLVQPTQDEGATSERPSEAHPTPSPAPTSEVPHETQTDSSLAQTNQAKEIQDLKAQITRLKKQAKPVIKHHKAWLKSVSLKQRFPRKRFSKKHRVHKESVSKQGRKFAKVVHMETENAQKNKKDKRNESDAQDVGRTRDVVDEEKENAEDVLSTKDVLSTAQQKVSTDKEKVSTDRPKVSSDGSKVSTDKEKDSTDKTNEGQVLLNMSQAKAVSRDKEKGVELKDVEETERPRPTSTRSLLTLKPLPKIDPKDKGKKKVEEEDESETESEGIPEAEKKFRQLASDEEMARKLQEDWETEEEKKRLAEEEATNDALIRNYDDIKARIEADRLLAERLQEEEREQFTVEERAKFLHDTIAAQRRFLAQQRSEAIRNKPPTKNQLRNQMMTYLKHVGNFQHSHLKTKKFEEIQALYEKIKRSDEDFIAIGSAEDERMIKEMNEKGIDSSKNESVKEEGKEEEGTKKRKSGHIKMIARKKPRKQSDDDSDDEHRKCLKIVTFEGILDSEIMEKKSVIARLDKVSSPDGDYLVIYRANGNFRAFNYLMEVLHILDRQDLFHLYELMMEQYSEITLEGFELILWGDLKIMMESSTEENDQSDFWSNQQDWKIITWRLYEACGVCILELEDGIVIHMLVERRYPLSKELLQRMLDLGLEVERESYALDLIRFIATNE
ncbi:hypothetical protein Tco_0656071 [Tanacetum coccineum]|uniref:Uncharacterized protein n=1 Tax=Tanacetum coccineum TaxID=301880 RepID=A0ABQ4X904_9ASTR